MRINSDKTEIRGTSVSTKSTLPGKIKSNQATPALHCFGGIRSATKTKKFQIEHVPIAVDRRELFRKLQLQSFRREKLFQDTFSENEGLIIFFVSFAGKLLK